MDPFQAYSCNFYNAPSYPSAVASWNQPAPVQSSLPSCAYNPFPPALGSAPVAPCCINLQLAYLDTAWIASEVRCELKRLKIVQSVFAEKLLGRTQGTLSALLTRPLPWHQLRWGAECYHKMYHWLLLDDQSKQSSLQLQSHFSIPTDLSLHTQMSSNQDERIKPSPPEKSEAELGKSESSKRKRARKSFTLQQKSVLSTEFSANQRPSRHRISQLASELNLTSASVANFFANSRQRNKHISL